MSRNRTAKASNPSAEKSNVELFSLTMELGLGREESHRPSFSKLFFFFPPQTVLTDVNSHLETDDAQISVKNSSTVCCH